MVLEIEDEEESSRIDCPVLVTERLVMRAPMGDDIPDLVELAANRRIADMLSRMPHPYGETEARSFVQMAARRQAGCVYALTLEENGTFIGCGGLEAKSQGLELGYWIGEPYWGEGYATEAAQGLIDLAFRATDVDDVHASCRVINEASRRVIHKCGFRYVGQGMIDSIAAGRVAVERYVLDRRTWIGLKRWAGR